MFHNRRFFVFTILSFCLLPIQAQNHPRLLFDAADIAELRSRSSSEPFSSMKAVIEQQASVAHDWVPDYIHDFRGLNSAFMYVLTGDVSWAQKTRAHVDSIMTLGQWAASVKGLRLYMHGIMVSLMYDWCYDAWDAAYFPRIGNRDFSNFR